MEWSSELIMKFLDFYQKETVIWNLSDKNHKNKNEVHDAWNRIRAALDKKYTVTELKKKKESLMASFRTCHNKVKKSVESGAGKDEIYKPSWFAYEKMASFLNEKGQPKEVINLETNQLYEDTESDETDKETNLSENTSENAEILPPASKSVEPPSQKKKKISETDELKNKMNEAYSILQSTIQKNEKTKDICDLYGELVAAKLRKLDEINRDIAMNQIDNLLFKMKINQSSTLKRSMPSRDSYSQNCKKFNLNKNNERDLQNSSSTYQPSTFDCEQETFPNENLQELPENSLVMVKLEKYPLEDDENNMEENSDKSQRSVRQSWFCNLEYPIEDENIKIKSENIENETNYSES